MARLLHLLKKWSGPLAVLIVLVIVAWVLWSYSSPPSTPSAEDGLQWAKWTLLLLAAGVLIAFVIWFLSLFTGVVSDEKVHRIIYFCYFFTILSLLGSVVPFVLFPILPGLNQVMLRSPIGIVAGCSKPLANEPKWVAKELQCDKDTDQWLVNIGGLISDKESKNAAARQGGRTTEAVKAGISQSPGPSGLPAGDTEVKRSFISITGGLVVPLYFVVLSLMGAAVSMTRRVPEYQGRVTLPQGSPKSITREQAREYLVFQIMQVISAPLIAITAYFLVEPGARASSVALGFASGFASETILLVIRALVEKLEPKTKPQT
jgi:hypothetical protein